jgi:hypothetical protein
MLMMMILLMMMMLLMMMKGHIEGELYPLYTQFPPNLDSHRQSLGWGRVVRIAVVGIKDRSSKNKYRSSKYVG